MTSGHSSHVFPSPPVWHLSIISLVGMPGSCHHHHGNVSVLPVAITMAMGVSPSNHQHGPNVSLLTKITIAICVCRKHWAMVRLGMSVWKGGRGNYRSIIGHRWYIFFLSLWIVHSIPLLSSMSESFSQFFTSHCISVVGGCHGVALVLSGARQEAYTGTNRVTVHPIPALWILRGPLGAHGPCRLGTSSSVGVLTHKSESWQNYRGRI